MELHDIEELASARALQNSALQAELDGTRIHLSEATQNLSSIQESNQTFQHDIERLNQDLSSKHSSISELQETLEKTNAKYEELNSDFESLVTLNDTLEKENGDLKTSVSLLEEKCEIANNSNQELTITCDKLDNEVSHLKNELLEQERSFPERVENSELVQSLKEKTLHLEDEVSEKKQVCIR